MAAISERKDRPGSWLVTWYDRAGQRRRRTFRSLGEARDHHALVELEERAGLVIDQVTRQPQGQMIEEFLDDYLAQHKTRVTPRTFRDDARAIRGFARGMVVWTG